MGVDYSCGAIIGCAIKDKNLPKGFDFYDMPEEFERKLKKHGLVMVRGEDGWSRTSEQAIIGFKDFSVSLDGLWYYKTLKASDLVNAHAKTKKVLEDLELWDEDGFGLHAYMRVIY